MKTKRFTALALTVVLAVSALFTGCGEPDANTTVASFGETNISYGLANFYLRYEQALYEANYMAYFGEDMWTMDLGNGTTMFDSMKTDAMSSLEQMYRLDGHAAEYGVSLSDEDMAKIQEAADKFMSVNKASSLKKMGATDAALVAEFLRVYTVGSRVMEAIRESTEITVTDEDAASKRIRFVRVANDSHQDEDGNYVDYTDDEKAALLNDLQAVAEEMQSAVATGVVAEASGDASADAFESVATAHDYTVSTYTYAADEDSLDAAVIAAANQLAEGQVSDAIEGEGFDYIVILDSAYDEEASASHKDELIYNQKSDHFTEVYEAMQAESEFVVVDKIWSKVAIDTKFSLTFYPEETTDASGSAE